MQAQGVQPKPWNPRSYKNYNFYYEKSAFWKNKKNIGGFMILPNYN